MVLLLAGTGTFTAGLVSTGPFTASSTISAVGVVTLNNSTETTTANTGGLVVVGGIGTSSSVYVGRNLTVIGTSLLTSTSTFNGIATFSAGIVVSNATDSNTPLAGSVTLAGGLGVAKAVNVGTTLTVVGKTTASSTFQANQNVILSGYQLSAPASGSTLTIPATVSGVIISVAGTLASLTIAFPTGVADGHTVYISTTQTITAITTTNATFAVNMGLTTMAGGQVVRYMQVGGTWYKV